MPRGHRRVGAVTPPVVRRWRAYQLVPRRQEHEQAGVDEDDPGHGPRSHSLARLAPVGTPKNHAPGSFNVNGDCPWDAPTVTNAVPSAPVTASHTDGTGAPPRWYVRVGGRPGGRFRRRGGQPRGGVGRHHCNVRPYARSKPSPGRHRRRDPASLLRLAARLRHPLRTFSGPGTSNSSCGNDPDEKWAAGRGRAVPVARGELPRDRSAPPISCCVTGPTPRRPCRRRSCGRGGSGRLWVRGAARAVAVPRGGEHLLLEVAPGAAPFATAGSPTTGWRRRRRRDPPPKTACGKASRPA